MTVIAVQRPKATSATPSRLFVPQAPGVCPVAVPETVLPLRPVLVARPSGARARAPCTASRHRPWQQLYRPVSPHHLQTSALRESRGDHGQCRTRNVWSSYSVPGGLAVSVAAPRIVVAPGRSRCRQPSRPSRRPSIESAAGARRQTTARTAARPSRRHSLPTLTSTGPVGRTRARESRAGQGTMPRCPSRVEHRSWPWRRACRRHQRSGWYSGR